MLRNKQQTKPPPPVKPKRDAKHWSSRVQETVVSALPDEGLSVTLSGGADNGFFVYLGEVKHDKVRYHSGKLHPEDVILEIQGQKVAGYTLRDATIWLRQVSQNGAPVMIKTVKQGQIPVDLRLYLNTRFQKGSVDHDLQQTIRDNLYMRTVPCTTRPQRPGEINGVDYTFLSMEEFIELEKSGCLLEMGIYDGNNYGTPKPPKEPLNNQVRRTNSAGTLVPGAHPSSDGKRRRNRSNVESSSSAKSSPVPFGDDDFIVPPTRKKSLERAHSVSNLGPLPANWELAYTEDGQEYYIDHDTETTHWLDPRLASLQKREPTECKEDEEPGPMGDNSSNEIELPYGWEKVEDPHYGTYYIDHVNRRTQYENPVMTAKKSDDMASEGSGTFPRPKKNRSDSPKRTASDSVTNGRQAPPAYASRKKPFFTKIPSELRGETVRTTLVKSTRGLGFTIIGGNEPDQDFLQIKNVVEDGPAFNDGQLKTGDVLVYVNRQCVLGFTHQDVIAIFQAIPPGAEVELEVCRGYSLPFDPDDPDTEILTTVAVTLPHGQLNAGSPMYSSNRSGRSNSDRLNTSQRSMKSLPDLTRSAAGMQISSSLSHSNFHHRDAQNTDIVDSGGGETPDVLGLLNGKPEILSVNIVRGEMGFGFTIADSAYGQKVKQIIDRPRCKNLQEGDVLLEVNNNSVRDMSHSQVAMFLKECPINSETTILVQRGGPSGKGRKSSKTPKTPDEVRGKGLGDSSFSSAPGAYFFSGGDRDSQQGSNVSDKLDDSTVSNRSAGSGHLDNHRPSLQQQHMPAVSEDASETTTDSSVFRSKTPTDSFNSSRPKTPNSMDSRSKTPTFTDSRPKTPTRYEGQLVDNRSKVTSPSLNRSQQMERLDKIASDNHQPASKDLSPPRENGGPGMFFHRDAPNSRVDFSPPSGHVDHSTRPPPGPRGEGRWQDHGGRTDGRYRTDSRQDYVPSKSNYAMHSFGDRRDFDRDIPIRVDRTDHARPGQFRSRTPGPEMMGRSNGPDYGQDVHRPKTPTAHDMRSKTPIPTSSNYAQNSSAIPDFIPSSRYNSYFNNSHVNGPHGYRPGYSNGPQSGPHSGRPRTPGGHNPGGPSPYSSPPMRRPDGNYNSPAFIQHPPGTYPANGPVDPLRGGYPQGSPGGHPRPPRQSTSFETEEPTPSNLTGMPRRFPPHLQNNHSPRNYSQMSDEDRYVEMTVVLPRQESGFGFRIIGGTEEGSQVSVGHIVPGGAADLDGRIRMHDEIISVDGLLVLNQSHHWVVDLMGDAAHNGRVTLGLRRRIGGVTGPPPDVQPELRGGNSIDNNYPYDVTVTRRETEGFGFVIISSVTKTGSAIGELIGRILENSPAERCNRLHVGDRILAVNGRDIAGMHHEDIVNLIKESGYSVTLTVGPPIDDASSNASTSQRSSQGSMINAMAYPAVSESDLSRRTEVSPAHYQTQPMDRYPPPPISNKEIPRHRPYGPPEPEDSDEFYTVELQRGSRGFGFSIRGGQEFSNMPLFVLRIAEGGAADLDGRLRVGDQILDINGYNTENMTHADAISLIQSGGAHVRMHVKRTGKPPPNYAKPNPSPSMSRLPPGVPMANGPIGHSSPHVMRRGAERDDYYYGNNYNQSRHPPPPSSRPYPHY